MTYLLGLRQEYVPRLPQVAKAMGLPLVRVLVLDPSQLTKEIQLPTF